MTTEKALAPEQEYWTIRLNRAAKALEKNGFGVSVHETGRAAAEHLVGKVLPEDWKGTVNFGGSVSVLQSGVVDLLKKHPGAEVLPTYDVNQDKTERMRMRRESFLCGLYLCSTSSLTMAGELLNVDGSGNRVASMIYGPEKVALFVGRNKLCETLEVAKDRVKNVASPMNNIRLRYGNPCEKTGKCMDCNSPNRICRYWTLIERCAPVGRIHVLLINEDLGF